MLKKSKNGTEDSPLWLSELSDSQEKDAEADGIAELAVPGRRAFFFSRYAKVGCSGNRFRVWGWTGRAFTAVWPPVVAGEECSTRRCCWMLALAPAGC
jgi:hypothetical protein